MKLKRLKSIGEHPLDNPRNFSKPGVWIAPDLDIKAYQKKLDEILGVTTEGRSIVRLSWAWDCKKWENTDWDEFGNATKGEWRQKYRALTIDIGDGDYVDIAPARFVLEERYEPEQYAHSWELTRYRHDPDACKRCTNMAAMCTQIEMFCVNRTRPGHEFSRCQLCLAAYSGIEASTSCERRDVWGEAPREGWYNLLASPGMSYPFGIVAEHDRGGKCCKKLWGANREICYGRFKFPDGRELRILRDGVARRNKDIEVNPRSKELDPRVLAQIRAMGLQEAEDARVQRRGELKDMWKDELAVHGSGIISPEAILGLKEARRRIPITRTIFS